MLVLHTLKIPPLRKVSRNTMGLSLVAIAPNSLTPLMEIPDRLRTANRRYSSSSSATLLPVTAVSSAEPIESDRPLEPHVRTRPCHCFLFRHQPEVSRVSSQYPFLKQQSLNRIPAAYVCQRLFLTEFSLGVFSNVMNRAMIAFVYFFSYWKQGALAYATVQK